MNTQTIKEFWQNNPCGEHLVLDEKRQFESFKKFFEKYDEFRYNTEGHILKNLDRIDIRGKKILEVGIGQAADSYELIKRDAIYYGMDITEEACHRAQIRFKIFNAPYKMIVNADVCRIPFLDEYFDVIYSHGVLHHISQISKAVKEIHRVLKKNGQLVIMLYARRSLNYYWSILFMRRLLFLGLFFLDHLTLQRLIKSKLLRKHIDHAKQVGLFHYLSTEYFLSKNTDGPDNPLSHVYSRNEVMKVFNEFHFERFEQHFLNERHLPLLRILPSSLKNKLSSWWGWHLWCYGIKP